MKAIIKYNLIKHLARRENEKYILLQRAFDAMLLLGHANYSEFCSLIKSDTNS